MTELAGTSTLLRLILRRDRLRIIIWVVAIGVLVLSTAASIKGLYPTQAELDQAAVASAGNTAAIAFNGPVQGLDTVGGQVAFQSGAFGLVLVGLMSLLMVGHCTRAEEESGRTELLRATVVGRRAETAAALIVVAAMNVVVGLLVGVALLSQGLPRTGSFVFAASFIAVGLFFSGVELVTAQVTENSRVASGLAGAVLGLSFALRAIGDIGDGRLSWLSPIGAVQKARPFAGDRVWPLLIPLTVTVVLLLVALALAAHRDVGAGLVPPHPGPSVAAVSLGRPLGLAVRLQRGTVIAWALGMLLTGFAYGAVANDIQSFVGDSDAMKEFIARSGGASLVDAYFGTALLIMALISAAFAVQSTQRLRVEETALHAEYVLATPTSRFRWVGSHLAVSLAGTTIVVIAAGLGAAVPYAVVARDPAQVPRIVGAMLVHLPAVWLLVGVTVALFGLVPRATGAAWAVLSGCLVVGLVGQLLKLPTWVTDLSPFEHTPQLPAAHFTVLPLAIMTAIATGLMAMGLAGFRHRDVG